MDRNHMSNSSQRYA